METTMNTFVNALKTPAPESQGDGVTIRTWNGMKTNKTSLFSKNWPLLFKNIFKNTLQLL